MTLKINAGHKVSFVSILLKKKMGIRESEWFAQDNELEKEKKIRTQAPQILVHVFLFSFFPLRTSQTVPPDVLGSIGKVNFGMQSSPSYKEISPGLSGEKPWGSLCFQEVGQCCSHKWLMHLWRVSNWGKRTHLPHFLVKSAPSIPLCFLHFHWSANLKSVLRSWKKKSMGLLLSGITRKGLGRWGKQMF